MTVCLESISSPILRRASLPIVSTPPRTRWRNSDIVAIRYGVSFDRADHVSGEPGDARATEARTFSQPEVIAAPSGASMIHVVPRSRRTGEPSEA